MDAVKTKKFDIMTEEELQEAVALMEQPKNKNKAERRRRTAQAKKRYTRTVSMFMSKTNPCPVYKFKMEHDCFSAQEKLAAAMRDRKKEDNRIKYYYGTVVHSELTVADEQGVEPTIVAEEPKTEEHKLEAFDFEDFTISEVRELLAKTARSNDQARYAYADLIDVLVTLAEYVDPKDYNAALIKKLMSA